MSLFYPISNVCNVKTAAYIKNWKNNYFCVHATEHVTHENSASSNESSRSFRCVKCVVPNCPLPGNARVWAHYSIGRSITPAKLHLFIRCISQGIIQVAFKTDWWLKCHSVPNLLWVDVNMMTASASRHCKDAYEEGDKGTQYLEKDLEKETWTLGFRCSCRMMKAAA